MNEAEEELITELKTKLEALQKLWRAMMKRQHTPGNNTGFAAPQAKALAEAWKAAVACGAINEDDR